MRTSEVAARLGIAPTEQSPHRFADGGSFRIEIPSVEGPAVMAAVVEEAERLNVTVDRVSQGSGALLLTKTEIEEMAAIGREHTIEVCLFVGPRAGFDTGVLAHTETGHYAAIRGVRQLGHAVADVTRAVDAGVRSFLVADLGLLSLLAGLKVDGALPDDCQWKVSAYLGVFNPAMVSLLDQLGASTINVASDLSVAELAELRSATALPLDMYVEAPAGMGGTVRIADAPDLVAAGAPMHLKFGLRNGPAVYPAGLHLENTATLAAREKVHRAAITLEWIDAHGKNVIQSAPQRRPGIPV